MTLRLIGTAISVWVPQLTNSVSTFSGVLERIIMECGMTSPVYSEKTISWTIIDPCLFLDHSAGKVTSPDFTMSNVLFEGTYHNICFNMELYRAKVDPTVKTGIQFLSLRIQFRSVDKTTEENNCRINLRLEFNK